MIIINIKQLIGVRENPQLLRGVAMADLPLLENAFLRIKGEKILDYGLMQALDLSNETDEIYDAKGAFVMPTWCDSHTHIVYAGSRENEFIDKIKGLSYAEIAQKGGGILNSAKRIAETSEDELFEQAWQRLEAVKQTGTGAIEIKSGYGLSIEGELKMLRVIERLKKTSNLLIKSTFLAAHTYPEAFKHNHQGYIRQIIDEMLPAVATEKLADYIDVFCEAGFFSVAETEQILEAGYKYGLKSKIHANQLNRSGGVQVGVKHQAISVDHLETMGDEEIACLSNSNTIGTLLPSAAFFLRMQYPPARQMLDANVALALASDFNPGSSPSGNMPLLIALSCIQMKMLPEEAINSATLNGAYAMEVSEQVGSITIGKLANLIFTKPIPSLAYFPYSFGENLIDKVMIRGKF
ncbi:imidazolonepropionase [Emticicia aquatilis]|uniref:Imidazolonepropionase n=1 Tax=Emticicia aquatilis TaxID=1537369 RepID=A0A917DN23_9BACT|nr:imidazolonepropionase [Emticicia aquatilis]GGD54623.1 imidazolonepropionase [Emticicia aquatilis]